MVKAITYFLLAVSTLIITTKGCDDACTADVEDNGRCYYSCTNACNFSPSHNRDAFLTGLSNKHYDCKPEAYNSLSCAKTGGFGSCWGHKWTCGARC